MLFRSDIKFVQTVKELLRLGRDPSVKQILMETLDSLQREKSDDESLVALIEMWKKEQEKMGKLYVSTWTECCAPTTNLYLAGSTRSSSNFECTSFRSQQPELLLAEPPQP